VPAAGSPLAVGYDNSQRAHCTSYGGVKERHACKKDVMKSIQALCVICTELTPKYFLIRNVMYSSLNIQVATSGLPHIVTKFYMNISPLETIQKPYHVISFDW